MVNENTNIRSKTMINFTVGPVQSSEKVRQIGSENVPYFRTPEFSTVMLENETLFKKFANAEENSRVVFITGSGTASMEAAVMNCFTPKDKVLVIDGGSFGHRFVQICEIHDIPHDVIKMETGTDITAERLQQYDGKGYTGFLVNIHETSTGTHYNGQVISDFCKRNNCFFVVDAISSFLADQFDMRALAADVMITGSQKALACPPGISIMILSEKAVTRVQNNPIKSMYFNLKDALKDGERGQTPFTPAVGTLLQIHARLKEIESEGGVESEQKKIAKLAAFFREGIKDLPLDICTESMSNAVTPLKTKNCSAYDLFTILKDEYGIWICPNGGDLKDSVFRVGHIGCLEISDYEKLLNALHDLQHRGILK